MANEEQLAILRQGVEAWNKWRRMNHGVEVDLSEANLSETTLSFAELDKANLTGTKFQHANLYAAMLRQAKLSVAWLGGANLQFTELSGSTLIGADLREAYLKSAILKECDLCGADLQGADLIGTNLTGSSFSGGAKIGFTNFVRVDLSHVVGLDEVIHLGPSSISMDTYVHSRGQIPAIFLRGCGVSDWEIEVAKLYSPALSNEEINNIEYRLYDLRARQALQISPLFISYSRADNKFVNKIGDALTKKGIRYWRDIHDMKAGRIEKQIDRAIRQNPTVLLVLSGKSMESDWVEHEVRTARGLKKDMGRDVLCPIALDDSWKNSSWPARIMEQIREYNILDFSAWEDDVKFEGMFRKLIDGLQLFYKG
jgi:hypothetical protein